MIPSNAGHGATVLPERYWTAYYRPAPAPCLVLTGRGGIVLFDYSWYNRAGVDRVMNFCTDEQYEEFFNTVPEFERCWRSGIQIVRCWFSIPAEEQHARFLNRIYDPLKQWKLSPMVLESRRRWKAYTRPRKSCWSVIESCRALFG